MKELNPHQSAILRLHANCTILANFTISNFGNFPAPNYGNCAVDYVTKCTSFAANDIPDVFIYVSNYDWKEEKTFIIMYSFYFN